MKCEAISISLCICPQRTQLSSESSRSVELASLGYQRGHLVASAAGYDQQRGGMMSVSGSGESAIEKQRRSIFDREHKIGLELRRIEQQRAQTREKRRARSLPVVSLLGYTNAGKSQLHSRLTATSEAFESTAEDKLFATLDTTAKVGRLPNGVRAIFVDTVGFIADLPHELVQSFQSTLADSLAADLLLHVRDVAHASTRAQCADVHRVLGNLRVAPPLLASHLEVWNKVDKLSPELYDSVMRRLGQEGSKTKLGGSAVAVNNDDTAGPAESASAAPAVLVEGTDAADTPAVPAPAPVSFESLLAPSASTAPHKIKAATAAAMAAAAPARTIEPKAAMAASKKATKPKKVAAKASAGTPRSVQDSPAASATSESMAHIVAISALTGDGIDTLHSRIQQHFEQSHDIAERSFLGAALECHSIAALCCAFCRSA
jgi:GTP-binding protein HflX